MQKEKILILTLGTGSILGNVKDLTIEEKKEKFERAIQTQTYSYRKITYSINGKEMSDTEFVAEPLIKSFCPNKIFIIGTVKSQWTAFYTKFGDGNEAYIRELYDLESENGIHTSVEKLGDLSQRITEIYRNGIRKDPFVPGIEIQIILTRYGVNQEQLLENYNLMRTIGNTLEMGKRYEVAFDITHSFRSLPIYNLVLLYYFRHVLQYDITISHVYYGNFEVSEENRGVAPIVDLVELIDVLELTTGINEFKNTGNAVTLLSKLTSKEELKCALEKFDWATQVNFFDDIEQALENLLKITEPGDTTYLNQKYSDLSGMVREVLLRKFFVENGLRVDNTEHLSDIPVVEKRFALAKWYLHQNRYGQAVVTAVEVLRSYFVPLYLEYKKKEVTEENCEVENYRRDAVKRLRDIVNYYKCYPQKVGKIEKLFIELNDAWAAVTPVRNSFAHNLKSKDQIVEEITDSNSPQELIEAFIRKLDVFRNEQEKNPDTVKKAYFVSVIYPQKKNEVEVKDNIKLIISDEFSSEFSRYRKSRNSKVKKIYTVYYLDEELRQLLNKNKNVEKKAVFLAKYIESLNITASNLMIILYGLNSNQVMNYGLLLESCGYSNIIVQRMVENNREYAGSFPKIEFGIDCREYENCILDSEFMEYLNSKVTVENGIIRKKGLVKL